MTVNISREEMIENAIRGILPWSVRKKLTHADVPAILQGYSAAIIRRRAQYGPAAVLARSPACAKWEKP